MKIKGTIMSRIIIIKLFFLIIVLFSCEKASQNPKDNTEPNIYPVPEETGDGWQTTSLNAVEINESSLLALRDSIDNNYYEEVHSVIIIKNGYLVFEEYYPGHEFSFYGQNYHGNIVNFDRDTPHITHSATKSIASALVGIAIDNGYIQNVDESIFNYFTQYSYLSDSLKNSITIKHLLTMTSGLQWNEWDVPPTDPTYDVVLFNRSSDPMAYLLAKPVVTIPGSSFYYNGGGIDALGQIVRIASGIDVDAFSGQYLFDPLGITDYQWQRLYPSRIIATHGDVYLRPRDMAKFGFLFLNNGVWDGNQIISTNWVSESMQQHISLPFLYWADSYGYLWWRLNFRINSQDYISIKAIGWGGQEIFIFPQLNMVVVFTGANYTVDPPCDEIMRRFILPALF